MQGVLSHWTHLSHRLGLLRVLAAGDEAAAQTVFANPKLYALALDSAFRRGFELSALASFEPRDLARFLGLRHDECFELLDRAEPPCNAELVEVLRVSSRPTLRMLLQLPYLGQSVIRFLTAGLVGESDLELSLLALVQNEPESYGLIEQIVYRNLANDVMDWPYRGVRTVSNLTAILGELRSLPGDTDFCLPIPPLAGAELN